MKAVQVLAGVAILLVMTATAGAEVYFPHVDTTDGWQTEIAVINTGDAAVTGTLKAYSDEGRVVETKTVMLAGRGRKQVSVASEFTSSGIGYLVLETSASSVVGYTKFYRQGQYGNYRVAVPAIREINTADMYVTHIDSGTQWWTGLSLVNTTGQAKTLTITFQTGETRTVTLEAYAHRAFTIASLFADQPRPDIRSAAITNANGIIGLELFATHDGKLMEGIVLTDKTATTLYYPHVAGSGWWTGVVAYNPSAQAGTITVTPYSAAGTALTVSTLSLPGKQNYVGAVFSDLVLPAQTAWFRIDSTVPLSGFELIGSDDFEQLAGCADVGSLGAKAGIFAKLEKSGWTGIALVNTEAAAASVTLTAYSDDGTVVATQVQSVGSHAKVVNSAEGFFSRSIATATYLAFTSDRNVVGLQFNGSVDWTLLDGLPALGATTATAASFPGTILLGAPTASSIRVNVLSPDQTGTVSVAYGTAPGRYGGQTEPAALLAGKPLELAIGGLAADTRYYYRPYFQASGDTAPAPTEEYTFHTARANGSTFTFTVQADSHLDENSDLELYRRTLANVLADAPDFHVDLGDTFMCEKKSAPLTAANQTARDQPTVDARYAYERTHFGIVTHSVPLFLANGNHEGESGTLADGTAQNLAVWATQARQRYYANPLPDGFYGGDTAEAPFVGRRAAWYAWQWGDALFVVLDPYWNTTVKSATDGWVYTLGERQCRWLAETLAASPATFKFVFTHSLVGGLDGQIRGGVEAAPFFEWGGRNLDGTPGYAQKRPGWGAAIHELLVRYGVTAVFHGHDHLYARQEIDGVIYQEVPQPSAKNASNWQSIAAQYHYSSGTILGSSGHLRVTVGPEGVTTRYVRAWLPANENGQRRNGQIDDLWSVAAPAGPRGR